MSIDNNAAFIWSDYPKTKFQDINSLEQLKHLIGAESIEGEGVGTVSGGNNGLYIVGAASNWSITITFSFKSKLKYTLDGTTTTQNLSTTHTINAPAQNALLTELNVGILPQELYRINQSPQFFYAEVSTNDVSTGKINKSSIPVAGPTGAILNWVQVNNYGIARKSFQGPVTQNLGSTGPYTFNNPTGVGLKPANFGLNETDYRIVAVDWNKGHIVSITGPTNNQILVDFGNGPTGIDVSENTEKIYAYNKTSQITGQTTTDSVFTSRWHHEALYPIFAETWESFLTLSPSLKINIQDSWSVVNGSSLENNTVIQKFLNQHSYPINFTCNTPEAYRSLLIDTWAGSSTSWFYYTQEEGEINITGKLSSAFPPIFDFKWKSNANAVAINGYDNPGTQNLYGGIANTVYNIKTNIQWLNRKMLSPFASNQIVLDATNHTHLPNNEEPSIIIYSQYQKEIGGGTAKNYGNCWLYCTSDNSPFTFPSKDATVTLKSRPSSVSISNFVANSNSDNKIFMPGNPALTNLTSPYIINDLNQLNAEYTVPTSFNTGYIIIAQLKRPTSSN